MKTIQVRYASADKNNKSLLYNAEDHAKFNEAIEVVIKMLDRLDRFDRVFAQE